MVLLTKHLRDHILCALKSNINHKKRKVELFESIPI